MTFRPADEYGPVLAGRGSAGRFRAQVEKLAERAPVVIDFDGITTVSPSFADELFAKLSPDLIEDGNVRFENMGDGIDAIARYVVGLRRRASGADGADE